MTLSTKKHAIGRVKHKIPVFFFEKRLDKVKNCGIIKTERTQVGTPLKRWCIKKEEKNEHDGECCK